MRGRTGAIIMAVLLLFYVVLVGQRAILFLLSGEPVGQIIAIALLILPAIAVWAIVRELLFGFWSQRLTRQLEAEGSLPVEDISVQRTGRSMRTNADITFATYHKEVQEYPDSWRAWFRLGLAYDASGDRRRARSAIRHAIQLSRR
jgi:cytochrome c-type biogenesis protein CcmH/NrfG